MNASVKIGTTTRMPYPGLRPFRREESDLFFGREGCVDDMVDKLAAERFLGILGSSGSGKSSLVRTGLLDALGLGIKASLGSDWVVVDTHPGTDPFGNLAKALLKLDQVNSDLDAGLLATYLRRGPRSVVDWCQEAIARPGRRILLLVDQFEELFRYGDYSRREEAEAFAALLLESTASADTSIYVALTMRSEFLGACSLIEGLAERINAGLYLTPRMTREQCRQAIVGPADVCGFGIEPALVSRMLNDVTAFAPWEDDETVDQLQRISRRADQLPLMQHVLNRLWLQAEAKVAKGEAVVLTLDEYEQVGGMQGALDLHGAEILRNLRGRRSENSLPPAGTETVSQSGGTADRDPLVETIFRALVSGGGGLAVRRPCNFGTLVALAGGDRAGVARTIDAFRAPDCNFLQPSLAHELNDGTLIDLAHESLIRQWSTLAQWAEREDLARAQWLRLSDSAQRHASGKAGLLQGIDLATNAQWWSQEKPSPLWAKRYGNNFDLVNKYLDTSATAEAASAAREAAREQAERDREAAMIAAEQERQRAAVRARQKLTWTMIAAVAAVVVIAAVIVGIFASDVQKKQMLIVAQNKLMEVQERANKVKDLALTAQDEALKAAKVEFRKTQNLVNLLKAQLNKSLAETKAAQYKYMAESGWSALANGNPYLAARYALAGLQLSPKDEANFITLLRAVQASGNYKGTPLYFRGKVINESRISPDGRMIAVAVSGKVYFYTVDGRPYTVGNQVGSPLVLDSGLNTIYNANFSETGKYFYAWSSEGVVAWDTDRWEPVIKKIPPPTPAGQTPAPRPRINRVLWAPDDNSMLVSYADYTLDLVTIATGKEHPIEYGKLPLECTYLYSDIPENCIYSGSGGHILIFGAAPASQAGKVNRTDSKVYVWNARDGSEEEAIDVGGSVTTIAASKTEQVAVSYSTADNDYVVAVWDVLPKKHLSHQQKMPSYVSSLDFSPDGKLLVIRYGRDAEIWHTDTYQKSATISHNQYISAVSFSDDSRFIVTTSSDNTAKVWTSTGEIQRVFQHDSEPTPIRFSGGSNGGLIFTSTGGNTITAWDLRSGQRLMLVRYDGDLYDPAVTRDGKTIVTVVNDSEVRISQVHDDRQSVTTTNEHRVDSYVTSAEGKFLFTSATFIGEDDTNNRSEHADYELWDTVTGRRAGHIESTIILDDMRLAVNNRYFLGKLDKGFGIGDMVTSRVVSFKLPVAPEWVEFSPDGHRVASCEKEKSGYVVKVWDAATGAQLKALPPFPEIPYFAIDGRRWGVTSIEVDKVRNEWQSTTINLDDNSVSRGDYVDLQNDEFTDRLLDQGYWAVRKGDLVTLIPAFAQKSFQVKGVQSLRSAVLSQSARSLLVRDTKSVVVHNFAGDIHAFKVTNVREAVLSPNGRLVAVRDGATVQIWDIQDENGRLMMTLPYYARGLNFLADSRHLVVYSGFRLSIVDLDGLYDDRDTLVHRICGTVFGPDSDRFKDYELKTDPLLSSNWKPANRSVCPDAATTGQAGK